MLLVLVLPWYLAALLAGVYNLLMPAGIGMLLRPLLDPFLTVLLVWYGLYVSYGVASPPWVPSQLSAAFSIACLST